MDVFYKIVYDFNFLSPVVLFTGILVSLYYYPVLDRMHKWIFYYLIIMLTVDLGSRILGNFGSNLIILPVYSLLEVVVITIFYYKLLFKAQHKLLKYLCCFVCLYIIWEIIELLKVNTNQFQSYAKVADNFIVISLALVFFHEKINMFKEAKWDNFRFNAVVLVYFFITMLFFLPINFLINESSGLKFYFWFVTNILIVLFYSYLTHSIWKNGRTRKLLPFGSR